MKQNGKKYVHFKEQEKVEIKKKTFDFFFF